VREPGGRALIDKGFGEAGAKLSHEDLLRELFTWLSQQRRDGFKAIGHRVVHGGAIFTEPVRIDDRVMQRLSKLEPLAPLHQPHNLAGIRACAALQPRVPQVACFDTAFHRTMDAVARRLALPRAYAEEGMQRYGFHGLSYEFIAQRLRAIDPDLAKGRAIVAHLGNGASLCAMRDGRSVDTTMSFTALILLLLQERGEIALHEIADLAKSDIRGRILGQSLGIERIVPLFGKHGRHAFAPDFLHRGQDAQFVVDQDVMIGRVDTPHIVEFLLLVDVDEDAVVEGFPQARSFHLARLEHGVAVGQDDRGSPLLHVLDRVQSAGIEPLDEWVVDQPARHAQHLRTMQVLRPVALQRAKVIGISELAPQLFKDFPVSVARHRAVGLLEVLAQMGLHAIVVDQRVVHVEQEDDVGRFAHFVSAGLA
jgi:Acetokinase family